MNEGDTDTDTVYESEMSSLRQQNAALQAREPAESERQVATWLQENAQSLAENDFLPKGAFPISPIGGHRNTFFGSVNSQDEHSGSHNVNSNHRRYCISSEI